MAGDLQTFTRPRRFRRRRNRRDRPRGGPQRTKLSVEGFALHTAPMEPPAPAA